MKIVLIGSGNLATAISTSIIEAGHTINQVVNRNRGSAKLLSDKIKSEVVYKINEIFTYADIYLIATPDSTISGIVEELPPLNGIVVHCSGGTSIESLKEVKAKGYGVLYPFQTFTKTRPVNLKTIPILVEGNSSKNLEIISNFARSLSEKVIATDSETRAWVHMSGVFTNNFINHLITISNRILNERGIDVNIINPLLTETIDKALAIGPVNAQTGPAIRYDEATINKHMKMLQELSPELAKIYKELSLSIQSTSKKNT